MAEDVERDDVSEDTLGMQLFRALGGRTRIPATREPKPYAGRVPVYSKLGTGPGVHVWLSPGKAAKLAVGQRLQVYLSPDRSARKAGVLVDGVRDTGSGQMWVMELF